MLESFPLTRLLDWLILVTDTLLQVDGPSRPMHAIVAVPVKSLVFLLGSSVDSSLKGVDIFLDRRPVDAPPFLYSRCRCTQEDAPLGSSTLYSPVTPSAYPPASRGPWLLGPSLSPAHALDQLLPPGEGPGVTSFPRAVCRDLEGSTFRRVCAGVNAGR